MPPATAVSDVVNIEVTHAEPRGENAGSLSRIFCDARLFLAHARQPMRLPANENSSALLLPVFVVVGSGTEK